MVPFASLSSTERTVDQGQAYIMDPPSLESYPNPTIKWFEISNEMHLLGQESQHYHITLQHQLVILETQMSYDRKVYKARATNSYTGQTSDSQMFVLHVQSKWSSFILTSSFHFPCYLIPSEFVLVMKDVNNILSAPRYLENIISHFE